MSLEEDLRDKQQIRDQLGKNDTTFPVIKFLEEKDFVPEEGATKFTTTTI